MARYQYSHRKESLPPSRKPTSDCLQPRPFPPIPEAQESAPSSLNPNIPPPQFSIAEPQGSRPQPLQPKLTLGAPGDKYEQEADRVASQVVQHINAPSANPTPALQRDTMPEDDELQMKPILQREAIPEEEELQMKPMLQRMEIPEEEELQMKSAPSAGIVEGDASPNLETGIQQARGGGQALAPDLQTKMGQAMGADFSQVRVHTDSQSDQLNRSIQAKAFTTGQDIFFRQGAYQPSNRGGQELIAHELTHVVQQGGGTVQRSSLESKKQGQPNWEESSNFLKDGIFQEKFKKSSDQASLQTSTDKCSITTMEKARIQRVYDDNTYTTLPYLASHKPPDFEYWVNSMWAEVLDVNAKISALALLKGTEDSPRAGGTLDNSIKKAVLDILYKNAYQEKLWVSAEQLIREGSLVHKIQAPKHKSAASTENITIAAGYHGTWRDPKTVIKLHKGTIPTIERHGKDPSDKAGIQEYMKTSLGIGEWHPFWFGGDISSRPFLFRNKQEDNELDTTISVAKSAIDSLDFPMIESMDKKDIAGYDDHGLPITYNYVYLVGVTQGFGTTVNMQQENAFGEGEMATQGLQAADHFGYVKYRRVHAGGSRNDGYTYERVFNDLLPGARQRNISKQVEAIISTMPKKGINRTDADAFDFKKMYDLLIQTGKAQANSALKNKFAKHKATWSNEQWEKEAEKQDAIKTAPSVKAKEIRLRKFLEGVRSVIPQP